MDFVRIIVSLTGAFAFSLLFNVKGRYLVFSSFGGLICGFLFVLLSDYAGIGAYFFSSIIVTIYAQICAKKLKTPATIYLVPGIIPLVPGGALYFTMASAVEADYEKFFYQGMETVYVAIAIAGGILIGSLFIKIKKGL